MRVDLHIHSTASDGTWSPDQLVQHVQQAGIGLFAVADHDSVASLPVVERLAREAEIGFIRAVEVSTTLDGQNVHLLAYGIDPSDESHPQHSAFLAMLDENRRKLASVDEQSVRKLMAAGYEIAWEEFEAYQNDVSRGGWKALNWMIDKGICRDVQDFFGRLFVGEMALQYPAFARPDQAVGTIRQVGGIPIWAHPGINLDQGPNSLVEKLLEMGVQGLECYSPYHDEKMTHRCLDLCRSRDLLITAGSDCHGEFVGRTLGVPEAHLDDLRLGPLLDCVVK